MTSNCKLKSLLSTKHALAAIISVVALTKKNKRVTPAINIFSSPHSHTQNNHYINKKKYLTREKNTSIHAQYTTSDSCNSNHVVSP